MYQINLDSLTDFHDYLVSHSHDTLLDILRHDYLNFPGTNDEHPVVMIINMDAMK